MKVPPYVHEVLEQSGIKTCDLEWNLTSGKKHYHLRIEGKLVTVLKRASRLATQKHSHRNTIAQIKRSIREIKEKK